eukprot:6731110-Prymnesium_polylepis.1
MHAALDSALSELDNLDNEVLKLRAAGASAAIRTADVCIVSHTGTLCASSVTRTEVALHFELLSLRCGSNRGHFYSRPIDRWVASLLATAVNERSALVSAAL